MSDNARYMTKCLREVLKPILPTLVHGTCWAHIINLFRSKWIDIFSDVNTFVSDMKSIFVHAPARGRRYQQFLPRKGSPVRLAPESILVRWNSWLNAVFTTVNTLIFIVNSSQKKMLKLLCRSANKYISFQFHMEI